MVATPLIFSFIAIILWTPEVIADILIDIKITTVLLIYMVLIFQCINLLLLITYNLLLFITYKLFINDVLFGFKLCEFYKHAQIQIIYTY